MSKLLRLAATVFALSLAAMPVIAWLHERWASRQPTVEHETRLGIIDERELATWLRASGYEPLLPSRPYVDDVFMEVVEGGGWGA